MPNTAITNIQAVLNTAVTSTGTLCTADTADLAEVFDITLTKSAGKAYIEIFNSAAVGTVTFSLAAGTGYGGSAVALTGSVLQATSKLIQVDDAKYKTGGVMTLTVTPSAGAKLKTGNIVYVKVGQLV